jgi:uncharacterized protein YlxW (UPF0749 family)
MENPYSGIISMLIASVTLLLSLQIYSRIQRLRIENERRNHDAAQQRTLSQLVDDNQRIHSELNELTEQVREMRRLLVEAG